MLFFLACFTNTHPSVPPKMETKIYELQQHVQRIEDLSNQLLSAQQQQDFKAIKSIMNELNQENTLLQEKKKRFQQSLKLDSETN